MNKALSIAIFLLAPLCLAQNIGFLSNSENNITGKVSTLKHQLSNSCSSGLSMGLTADTKSISDTIFGNGSYAQGTAQQNWEDEMEKTKSAVEFFWGSGLNYTGDYSKDFQNYFKNHGYTDVGGGYFWINIDIGVNLRIVDNVYLKPSIRYMAGLISIRQSNSSSSYSQDKSYINSILQKKLGAEYVYHLKGKSSAVILGASLSFNDAFPDAALSGFKYSTDGPGYEFALGWENYDTHFAVELAYNHIPMSYAANAKREYGGVAVNAYYNINVY